MIAGGGGVGGAARVPRAFVMHLCNRIFKIQLQPGIVIVEGGGGGDGGSCPTSHPQMAPGCLGFCCDYTLIY